MGDCDHMVGLHETGENYVPIHESNPRKPDAPGYDYYFSFCPECGKNLDTNESPGANQGTANLHRDLRIARDELEQATAEIERLRERLRVWPETIEQQDRLLGMKQQRIEQLEAALREAITAIESLDDGALGYGQTDDVHWPLRDELLSNIKPLIAGISNLSDSPKPIDSDESESVACPRCGVEFPHRCEYDPD